MESTGRMNRPSRLRGRGRVCRREAQEVTLGIIGRGLQANKVGKASPD